jgi:beta-galactosidase/beta-glucuronidase
MTVLGKQFGCDAKSISRRLKKLGVKARPFSTKGIPFSRLGYHHSIETKEKLRQAHLGKKLTEEHRLKVIQTLNHGTGNGNNVWKGGKVLSKDGYVYVRQPDHPNALANGYVREHRLVMETKLGRLLEEHEVVHHINGFKDDNRPENLELLTQSTHSHEHWDRPEMKDWQAKRVSELRSKRFWSSKKK